MSSAAWLFIFALGCVVCLLLAGVEIFRDGDQ